MATRFTFPPVNLGSPIEAQMLNRAEWVGYKLARATTPGKGGARWQLSGDGQTFTFASLCEVDMKLAAILEEIGDRIEREETARMSASRVVAREADQIRSMQ